MKTSGCLLPWIEVFSLVCMTALLPLIRIWGNVRKGSSTQGIVLRLVLSTLPFSVTSFLRVVDFVFRINQVVFEMVFHYVSH